MRKYLINPNKRYIKANLHSHTTNSDGEYTPEKVKELYKARGYQAVAFTDHEVLVDNSYLDDDNFIAITSSEYSINQEDKPVTDTYIDMKSWKMTYKDKKTIHLCLYSKKQHNTFQPACTPDTFWPGQEKFLETLKCDGYKRVFTKESINETIKRANEAGFLVQYNHPSWSMNIRDDYMNMEGLWSFEIFNFGTDRESGGEYNPGIYDDMLRHGKKVFCSMGDDNHNWGNQLFDSFGAWDWIEVDEFNYENIMNSLEKGNFYCSSGPVIKALYLEENEQGKKQVTVECSEAVDVILNGYNRSLQNKWGENLTKVTFTLKGNEVYFRITVRDKYGKVAHTHAYFLDE